MAFHSLLLMSFVSLVIAHAAMITPAPSLRPRQDSVDSYDCDGAGMLFCPTSLGTCYSGEWTSGDDFSSATNTYIGCCTTNDCSVRTTCYNYDQIPPDPTSGIDTGGYTTCGDAASPSCFTLVNDYETSTQIAYYCSATGGSTTEGYRNVASLSLAQPLPVVMLPADPPASVDPPSPPSTSSGPVPTITGHLLPIANDPTSQRKGLSKGAIAGIAVGSSLGGLALLCCLPCIALRQHRRRKPKQGPGANEQQIPHANPPDNGGIEKITIIQDPGDTSPTNPQPIIYESDSRPISSVTQQPSPTKNQGPSSPASTKNLFTPQQGDQYPYNVIPGSTPQQNTGNAFPGNNEQRRRPVPGNPGNDQAGGQAGQNTSSQNAPGQNSSGQNASGLSAWPPYRPGNSEVPGSVELP